MSRFGTVYGVLACAIVAGHVRAGIQLIPFYRAE